MAIVWIYIVLCLLAYWYYKNVYRFNKVLSRYPAPPEVPILGHALDFANSKKGTLQVLIDYTQNYGDIVRVKTGPKRQLLLTSNYKLLEFILTSTQVLDKSMDYRNLERWLGTGLLTATGLKWKRHRLMLTPTFHYKILEDFVDIFEKNAKILGQKLAKEQESAALNIHPLVTFCTLDIICETSMGISVNAQENSESDYVRSVKEMCTILIERAFSPHKMFDTIYFFTETYKREKKALKIIHDYTIDVIKKRRGIIKRSPERLPKKKKAFLDLLLEANIDGVFLTLDEIRQEVDTFMFAGHDTTGSAISFALYNIANHPEVQERLIQEQREIFEDNFTQPATLQELKGMKYLEMVIRESLRLYPSVPFYAREIPEDMVFDGGILPKGLTVTMFMYALHRNPDIFPDPEKFDPSRFESIDGKLPFAYLPFSAGPRNCIGQKFAMVQMKCVLSRLIRDLELFPAVPHHELELEAQTVLVSRNGIRIRVAFRDLTQLFADNTCT